MNTSDHDQDTSDIMDVKSKCINDSKDKNSSRNDSSKNNEGYGENHEVDFSTDFLPSFEMHNFMFNRTIYDTEYIRGGDMQEALPPKYEDQNSIKISDSKASLDIEAEPQPHRPVPSRLISAAQYVDPTTNPDLLVLNNLNALPTLKLPIKLTIVLTRQLPLPGVHTDTESPFKVYKPGDVVTGYVLIENTTSENMPFEMFLVSLEGTITTRDSSINAIYNDNDMRQNRRKLKRSNFLKMYDLCACYHHGIIDAGPTADHMGEPCPQTGAVYGFNENKIMNAGEKYKKFFMFKLPDSLLDISCEHQSPNHLNMPPSFGVDIESFEGQAEKIEVDKKVGYGCINENGAPIKTNDLAMRGQSISYSINVRMIGRHLDWYKQYYNHGGYDLHDFDFVKIREFQHFFRVSTAGHDSSSSDDSHSDSDWFFKSNVNSETQVKQIERLCQETTEVLKLKRDLISAGVTDVAEQDNIINSRPDSKKTSQLLSIQELRHTPKYNSTKFKGENFVENVTSATLVKGLFNRIEGELSIIVSTDKKNSISSFMPESLERLSKVSKTTKDEPDKFGSKTGIFKSERPLLTKNFSSKSQFTTTSSSKSRSKQTSKKSESIFDSRFTSTSAPSSTHNAIPKKLNESIDAKLSSRSATHDIEINLTFNPHRTKPKTPPPTTLIIKPKLQIINIQSDNPIPITIDGEFLLESSALQSTRNKIDSLKAHLLEDYLQKWKDITKGTNLKVPKTLYMDTLALSKMHVDLPSGIEGVDLFEKYDMII
ncbi:unnamed protein product [Ambrosiozyma monospora]|uniref:Unnamed protein product n=1 Tax=Ambrosiozyma monospora TaxID=43982 RepID=A0ACB5T3M7_AMBMO|nr:unnamed protein product [Ambrosiozyma monospora]